VDLLGYKILEKKVIGGHFLAGRRERKAAGHL
jgi:hypothetical protein